MTFFVERLLLRHMGGPVMMLGSRKESCSRPVRETFVADVTLRSRWQSHFVQL